MRLAKRGEERISRQRRAHTFGQQCDGFWRPGEDFDLRDKAVIANRQRIDTREIIAADTRFELQRGVAAIRVTANILQMIDARRRMLKQTCDARAPSPHLPIGRGLQDDLGGEHVIEPLRVAACKHRFENFDRPAWTHDIAFRSNPAKGKLCAIAPSIVEGHSLERRAS